MFSYSNFPVRHEGIPKTGCFVLFHFVLGGMEGGREGRREGWKEGRRVVFLVKQQFTVVQ